MTVVLGDVLPSGEVSLDQELLKSIPNISGRYQLVEQLTTEPPPPPDLERKSGRVGQRGKRGATSAR